VKPHCPDVASNKGGSDVTRLILRINTVLFNIVKSTRPASTLLASSLFSSFSFRLSKHCKHREGKGTGEGCKPSSLTRGSMLSETLVSGNDLAIPEPYSEQRTQDVKQAHFCLTHLTPIRSWISSVNHIPCIDGAGICLSLATHNTPKS
jgi:hypothetical protein